MRKVRHKLFQLPENRCFCFSSKLKKPAFSVVSLYRISKTFLNQKPQAQMPRCTRTKTSVCQDVGSKKGW